MADDDLLREASAEIDAPGDRIVGAICYLRVALCNVDPSSPHASAPYPEPPADWPFIASMWHPTFDDPANCLVEAADLLNIEYDLLTNPSSFDDDAPAGEDGGR